MLPVEQSKQQRKMLLNKEAPTEEHRESLHHSSIATMLVHQQEVIFSNKDLLSDW